jgi:hypothetical protein
MCPREWVVTRVGFPGPGTSPVTRIGRATVADKLTETSEAEQHGLRDR